MVRGHRFMVLCVVVVGLLANAAARAQEIWFSPQGSFNRPVDFRELFEPDAPWARAASRIRVFKLYASYLSNAPQEEVDAIVTDLNRRHIALALEAGIINIPGKPVPACGGAGLVEGYGTPETAKGISEKIKRAGGAFRFIALDEPLWYGHFFNGKPGGQPGCKSDIDALARLIEPSLRVYKEEFPQAIIGEVEPTNIARQPDWQAALRAWTTTLRKVTGEPLAFMQLDIPFARPNEERFALMFFQQLESLKQQKLLGQIGVIYDGTPTDATDESWVKDAQSHIRLIEITHGLHPDQAIIQSWHPHPTHTMPDTAPDSLTGLVNYYYQLIESGQHAR